MQYIINFKLITNLNTTIDEAQGLADAIINCKLPKELAEKVEKFVYDDGLTGELNKQKEKERRK